MQKKEKREIPTPAILVLMVQQLNYTAHETELEAAEKEAAETLF